MANARSLETCRAGRPEAKFCKAEGVKPTELQWKRMTASRARFDNTRGAVRKLHRAMITPVETESIPAASEGIAPGALVVKLGHQGELDGRQAAEAINTSVENDIWKEYDAQIQAEVDASWALHDKSVIVEGMVAWGISPDDLGNIDAEQEELKDIHTLIAEGDEGMVLDGLVPLLEDDVVSLEALRGANSRTDQEAIEGLDSEASVAWLEENATPEIRYNIIREPVAAAEVVAPICNSAVVYVDAYQKPLSVTAQELWVEGIRVTGDQLGADYVRAVDSFNGAYPDSVPDMIDIAVETKAQLIYSHGISD